MNGTIPEVLKVDGKLITLFWLDPEGRRHEHEFHSNLFRGKAIKASRVLLSGGAKLPTYNSKFMKEWVERIRNSCG